MAVSKMPNHLQKACCSYTDVNCKAVHFSYSRPQAVAWHFKNNVCVKETYNTQTALADMGLQSKEGTVHLSDVEQSVSNHSYEKSVDFDSFASFLLLFLDLQMTI